MRPRGPVPAIFQGPRQRRIGVQVSAQPPVTHGNTKVLLLALSAVLLAGPIRAAGDDYNAWQQNFYRTQDIGQFDGFWNMVVDQRLLEKKNAVPPIEGFTSRVLHRYPSLIRGRLDRLSEYPEDQREIIQRILWLSDTTEARSVLNSGGDRAYVGRPPPGIAGWKIQTGGDLDFCWGWFFATGDTAALDSIISALDLGKDAGALKRFPTSAKTDADRQAALNDAIFGAAMWSLGSIGRTNHDVAKHIAILFFSEKTPKDRKLWLGPLFVKTSPDIPRQELEDDRAGR